MFITCIAPLLQVICNEIQNYSWIKILTSIVPFARKVQMWTSCSGSRISRHANLLSSVTIPNETYFVGAEFSVTLRPQNFHVNV